MANKKENTTIDRLLRRPTGSRPEMLEDLIWVIAATIEESILESSYAVPGKDYTVLDLYKLAQPFALSTWDKTGNVSFISSWNKDDIGVY